MRNIYCRLCFIINPKQVFSLAFSHRTAIYVLLLGALYCRPQLPLSLVVFHQHQIKIRFTGPDLQSFLRQNFCLDQVKLSQLSCRIQTLSTMLRLCVFQIGSLPLITSFGTLYVCVPTLFTQLYSHRYYLPSKLFLSSMICKEYFSCFQCNSKFHF